jgi:FMN phosphatase YigB (HAD superfamily)
MTPTTLSKIGHTWLVDLDGTLTEHNSHLRGGDVLLPEVRAFWEQIPAGDMIVILTARESEYREHTTRFLESHGLRHDILIMDLPKGERIVINDRKPDGLAMALAVNLDRNAGFGEVLSSIRFEA